LRERNPMRWRGAGTALEGSGKSPKGEKKKGRGRGTNAPKRRPQDLAVFLWPH